LAQDYSGSNYDLYEAELHLRQGDYAKAQAIIEKCLSLATPKWSKTRLETLTAIRDGLSAKTQKPVILALFETYKKLRN
ncbi:MAG: hypothetical protein ACXU8U_09045, partial [Asticcacaulis sp.]